VSLLVPPQHRCGSCTHTIIERKDSFEARFRVELEGRLWRCICGHWCFNLGLTAIGKGEDLHLSDVDSAAIIDPTAG